LLEVLALRIMLLGFRDERTVKYFSPSQVLIESDAVLILYTNACHAMSENLTLRTFFKEWKYLLW